MALTELGRDDVGVLFVGGGVPGEGDCLAAEAGWPHQDGGLGPSRRPGRAGPLEAATQVDGDGEDGAHQAQRDAHHGRGHQWGQRKVAVGGCSTSNMHRLSGRSSRSGEAGH